jgi:hypothetical protein
LFEGTPLSSGGEISEDVQNEVWKSVFMIREKGGGSSVTALVWDLFGNDIYLLLNLHFMVDVTRTQMSPVFNSEINAYCTNNGVQKPKSASTYGDLEIATTAGKQAVLFDFSMISSMCYYAKAEYDVAILKVPLNAEEWNFDNGCMTRVGVEINSAASSSSSKRKRAPSTKAKASVRSEVPQGTTVVKIPKCAVATPSLTSKVFIFGFPGITKTIIPAIVASNINIHSFSTTTALSAAGMSGSAIIVDSSGLVVGYLGGNFDSSANNEQYASYGYSLACIPDRLSSRNNSPEKRNSPDAASKHQKT